MSIKLGFAAFAVRVEDVTEKLASIGIPAGEAA